MKNIFITLLSITLLLMVGSCEVTEDTAEEVNPATYPVLTITPNMPSGQTINEGDAPAFTFAISMDKMLDRPVKISARQTGGAADAADYAFSSVTIAPYTTEATFTLSINPDGITEDTETLEFEVGAFDPGSMFTVTSEPVSYSVTIENCASCVTCDWRVEMHDSYGDGWNGGYLTFDADGTAQDITNTSTDETAIVPIPDQSNLTISYSPGAWEGEVSFEIYDQNGNLVYSDGPNPATGEIYSTFNECP